MTADQAGPPQTEQCPHRYVTSTFKLGPHCVDCGEPLISLFSPISRNTPVGALLYALRKDPTHE